MPGQGAAATDRGVDGQRVITGRLYNGAASSVLIAGLFHSMHNAIVNF